LTTAVYYQDDQEHLLERIAMFQTADYSFDVLAFVQDFLRKTVEFDDAALAEMDQKHYQYVWVRLACAMCSHPGCYTGKV
jgi:hypothetical protein